MQTTSNLSNAVRTKYIAKYIEAAMSERVYDMFASPVGQEGVADASFLANSVQVNFLSKMPPGTDTISQLSDVVPTALKDATATISPTSRYGALQWAEAIDLMAYTNYGEERFKMLGQNQMETVDLVAQAQALTGTNVYRAAARASLDAGTHKITDTIVSVLDVRLQNLKVPSFLLSGGMKRWNMVMPPSVYHDLRLGGNIVNVGLYQDKRIILNFEVGEVGPFRLISTPWAKEFLSAGAANSSAIATTLSADADALDKTISVAAATNMAAGDYIMVGTIETGDTHYATNERLLIGSISGTDITILGSGSNGGLQYDHASGETVSNADTVYPVVVGGPSSMAKLFDSSIGEFGQVVGPKVGGALDQFKSVGWKWYGNYGRWVEPWLLRAEFASSLDA
jgi:hypothetical protein